MINGSNKKVEKAKKTKIISFALSAFLSHLTFVSAAKRP
jgi:hypothetical protein